jgi:hypothetical protein
MSCARGPMVYLAVDAPAFFLARPLAARRPLDDATASCVGAQAWAATARRCRSASTGRTGVGRRLLCGSSVRTPRQVRDEGDKDLEKRYEEDK